MKRLVPQARFRYSTCSAVGFIRILCAVFIFERLLSRFAVLTRSVQVTAKTLGYRVECLTHICTLHQDLVNTSIPSPDYSRTAWRLNEEAVSLRELFVKRISCSRPSVHCLPVTSL